VFILEGSSVPPEGNICINMTNESEIRI